MTNHKNKNKHKLKKINRDNYKLWSNGRLFSLILLGIAILMFVLSLINLPFFAIFPGYTFGFLFGYYSYIFYCFLIFYSVSKLFNIKIFLIKWISKFKIFYYSWFNFFLLILGIIIFIESCIYISNKNNIFPGLSSWSTNFNNFWDEFTNNNDALKPNINNSGVVINIIISTLFSIGGTIISIIASFILIGYFFFYLFFSSPIKKFNNKKKIKGEKEWERKEYETKILDLSFEDNNKIISPGFQTEMIEINRDDIRKKEIKEESFNYDEPIEEAVKDATIPFDNPFDDVDVFIAPTQTTAEINLRKRKRKIQTETEFIFDNHNVKEPKKPNIYQMTKEFDLDNSKGKNKNKKRKK